MEQKAFIEIITDGNTVKAVAKNSQGKTEKEYSFAWDVAFVFAGMIENCANDLADRYDEYISKLEGGKGK